MDKITKEILKNFENELKLARKLDEHYWEGGYPKLENQLKDKIYQSLNKREAKIQKLRKKNKYLKAEREVLRDSIDVWRELYRTKSQAINNYRDTDDPRFFK